MRKYHESFGYAQICANRIRRLDHTAGAAYRGYLNLVGAVYMALAGCFARVERDCEKALHTLEGALLEVQDSQVPVERLIREMILEVRKVGSDASEASFRSLGEASLRSYGDAQDFLVTSDYLNLVFATLFVPFISTFSSGPTTPLMRRQDLEEARVKEAGKRNNDEELLRVVTSQGDAYTLVMNSIVAEADVKADPEPPLEPRRNKAAERIRKYRISLSSQSNPRILLSDRPVRSFLHDWTTLQFHTPRVGGPRRNESLPPSKPASTLTRRRIATERQLPLIPQAPKSTRRHYRRDRFAPSRLSQPTPTPLFDDTPLPPIALTQRRRRKAKPASISVNRSIQIQRQTDVSIAPSPTRAVNLSVLEAGNEL